MSRTSPFAEQLNTQSSHQCLGKSIRLSSPICGQLSPGSPTSQGNSLPPQAILCLLKRGTLLMFSFPKQIKLQQEPKTFSQGRQPLDRGGVLTFLLCQSSTPPRGDVVIESIHARSAMQSKSTGLNSFQQRMEVTLHFQHLG